MAFNIQRTIVRHLSSMTSTIYKLNCSSAHFLFLNLMAQWKSPFKTMASVRLYQCNVAISSLRSTAGVARLSCSPARVERFTDPRISKGDQRNTGMNRDRHATASSAVVASTIRTSEASTSEVNALTNVTDNYSMTNQQPE